MASGMTQKVKAVPLVEDALDALGIALRSRSVFSFFQMAVASLSRGRRGELAHHVQPYLPELERGR